MKNRALTPFVLLFVVACSSPPPENKKAAPKPVAGAKGAAPAAGGGARGQSTAAPMPTDLPPLPVRKIEEGDFNESPVNRDPFRSFADYFAEQEKQKRPIQREVLISRYSLDEVKIVGIITGGAGRALINDPTGLGWVVKVGDFVGKPEILHRSGTSADITVNWRVDRIRDNDVIFVREDPSRPNVQPTTRTLVMRTPEEQSPEIRTGLPRSAPDALPPVPGLPAPPKGG